MSTAALNDFELLAIQAATIVVLSAEGRILRLNDPGQSAAPRLSFSGCQSGNLVRIRHDVSESTARAITRLAAGESLLG